MTIHDSFWNAAQRKGFVRYTLESGCPFALIMFTFTGVIYDQFSEGFFTLTILKHLFSWLGAGILFGMYQWFSLKRKVIKHTSST